MAAIQARYGPGVKPEQMQPQDACTFAGLQTRIRLKANVNKPWMDSLLCAAKLTIGQPLTSFSLSFHRSDRVGGEEVPQ
jgi:hypothetical protein